MARECITLFTVGSLRDLLIEERDCLRALSGPVEELREKLTLLEDMFDDIDVRRDERTLDVVHHCNLMIDDVDYYVFRESTKIFGFRERKLRPKLLLKIRQLIAKISNLMNSHSGKTIQVVGQGSSLGLSNKVPPLDEEDFVGRDKDIECLVSYLEDSKSRVISICGIGGLGKTTLSRKLCKHELVTCKFERYAFVRMGRECDVKIIMQKFLQELVRGKREEDIRLLGDEELVEQLQKVLSEKKCLVVIDDIWSVDAWTSVCRALPTNDVSHSKVLLTTRNRDVAEVGDIVHHLKGLSEDESWELLKKKALAGIHGRDLYTDNSMEKLGKKMVGWCKGNPLAIRVLRGVLVTKPSLPEWERVFDISHSNRQEQLGNPEVDEVLSLSYNELPYQLKPCYLYLCRFRHMSDMKTDKLYMLWNAEGMILSRDKKEGETATDVAERYLDELVQRNMVEFDVDSLGGTKELRKIKLCNLHDLMQDLCFSIVKKEDFFKLTYLDLKVNLDSDQSVWVSLLGDSTETETNVFSEVGRNSMKIQRHSIDFSANARWYVDATPDIVAHLRSLKIYQGSTRKLSNLKKLKLLRVLDIERVGTNDANLGKGIGKLIHLRYLCLRRMTLGCFPSSLCNLRQLQTLDLRVSAKGDDVPVLPKLFWKLPKLRHLFLPKVFRMQRTSSFCRLHGLPELETLVNFLSPTCCANDLSVLTKLSKFKAAIILDSENPNGIKDLEVVMNYIKLNVNQLRYTSLSILFLEMEAAAGWKPLLLGCQQMLHSLGLTGLVGDLPDMWSVDVNNQQYPFSLLTKLSLARCTFEQWPLPTLEKLSNLTSLSFERFKVEGSNEINFSASGFPQLRKLGFTDVNLEKKWTIEQGAMPNLSKLEITRCSIEMLPEGLIFITTLQQLLLLGLPDAFKDRIEPPDGEDFYKVRHIPKITVMTDDDLRSVVNAYTHDPTTYK